MTERSDGSTASYYELPTGATQLQDLISHRDMNAQIGEIFRACYRMGLVEHSDRLRDAKKILFYAKAEVERLERLPADNTVPLVVTRQYGPHKKEGEEKKAPASTVVNPCHTCRRFQCCSCVNYSNWAAT